MIQCVLVKNFINHGKVTIKERGISMNKRYFWVVISLVLVVCIATILVVNLSGGIKMPELKDGKYVYDMAHIIKNDDESALNSFMEELHSKTNVPLYVVTVKNLNEVDEYAEKVFAEWRLESLSPISQQEFALIVYSKKTNEAALKTTSDLADLFEESKFAQIVSYYKSKTDNCSDELNGAAIATGYVIASKYDADITNLRSVSPYETSYVEFGVIIVAIMGSLCCLIFLLNKSKGCK